MANSRGGQPGNQNGRKAKVWTDALKWALENAEISGIERGQTLRAIATTVVTRAVGGDKDAWNEIANRLDGKPAQVIVGDADDDPVQVQGFIKLVRPGE